MVIPTSIMAAVVVIAWLIVPIIDARAVVMVIHRGRAVIHGWGRIINDWWRGIINRGTQIDAETE